MYESYYVPAIFRPQTESVIELWMAMAEVEARHLGSLGLGFDDVAAPFSLGDVERVRFEMHSHIALARA
jgi:hypothetical protein